MRRTLLTVTMMLAIAAPAQARVEWGASHHVSYFGAVPCATVCAYWIDNGFTPCEAPFPPGAYIDRITVPAPAASGRAIVLAGEFRSPIDWDFFACENTDERTEIAQGANFVGDPCYPLIPLPQEAGMPTGCQEALSAVVAPGSTTVLRGYNWSDGLEAFGTYRYGKV